MKKLLTLALALGLAFTSFAQVQKVASKSVKHVAAQERVYTGTETLQHVGNQPNMTRVDYNSQELDYSYYDWQTNTAAKNATMNFPDGCVGFAYTISTDGNHTDRGTDIIIYNPNTDEWTTTEGKIEEEKTGFGCAARYGENGIVVVSRNAVTLNCGVYIIEDKDNLPATGTVKPIIEWTKDDRNIHFPTVMCTGPNHDHIHILFTALNYTDENGLTNPFFYFRSMDGGQTWDEFMTIDYLGRDYASAYGSGQDAYFIENTGGNELNIVVNTRRGDGALLTSYDEGNTWERKVYYKHPNIDGDFTDSWYMYPRWTSALKDNNGKLRLAFEFGGGTGEISSTNYYPGIGGVAYWSESMPYADTQTHAAYGYDPNNPMPPTPGQPFIMDSAYMYNDIYAAWPRWSDQTWDNPAYFGYLAPLDEEGNWQSWEEAEEFNIEDFTLHGSYNGGICEMPVLLMTPAQDLMVAVWISMDEHNMDELGNFYFKLFTSCSEDGGLTWSRPQHITNDFMLTYTEFVYPQAALTNNKLIITAQVDGCSDTNLLGDDPDPTDNYFMGLIYDLEDLFGYDGIGEGPVMNNTTLSVYPNPVSERLTVNLNQEDEVVIYNMMGQTVSSFQGHTGINTVDVSNLSSGIYFISAGSATQKFVVK